MGKRDAKVYSKVVSIGLLAMLLISALLSVSSAEPVIMGWPVNGGDDTVAVAAGLQGCYATGDAFEDAVEIRDRDKNLQHTITRNDIRELVPSFSLSGGQDGISGLAFTDSCRLLYILVHDDTAPPDVGEGSDVVLVYNTWTTELHIFASLDLFNRGDSFPFLAALHHAGRLYVGTANNGISIFQASGIDETGILLGTQELPDGGRVQGLAVDNGGVPKFLYAASSNTIFRAPLSDLPLEFTEVGTLDSNIQGVTYTGHFGTPMLQEGLYIMADRQVWHLPNAQDRGGQPFSPTVYVDGGFGDIAATPEGSLLLGAGENALMVREDADPRLTFSEFVLDEFNNVLAFAKSLITSDFPGWVIDANVPQGQRFHPATPDGAAWTVLILLMSDRINSDMEAQALVRTILVRYAGLAPDGIVPERTENGIYRHYYEPSTGSVMEGWDPEYSILSTMLIVLAATRAQVYFPNDQEIQAAASRIISEVNNWDAYLTEPPECQVYLRGLAGGGPDLESPLASGVNETLLFVEQASHFGGSDKANSCFEAWLDRSRWPTTEFVAGRPLTSDQPDSFLPAFVSQYVFLLQPDVRLSPSWQAQIENLLVSSSVWTDDNGPHFFTVFSAGTTDPELVPSGYHADNLGDHPGDIAHFPGLLAFSSRGNTGPAVAAYDAYRLGARQRFEPESHLPSEILYRRSNQSPAYEPNSAGLPDVIFGALGLSALLDPTAIDAVLAIPYPILP